MPKFSFFGHCLHWACLDSLRTFFMARLFIHLPTAWLYSLFCTWYHMACCVEGAKTAKFFVECLGYRIPNNLPDGFGIFAWIRVPRPTLKPYSHPQRTRLLQRKYKELDGKHSRSLTWALVVQDTPLELRTQRPLFFLLKPILANQIHGAISRLLLIKGAHQITLWC